MVLTLGVLTAQVPSHVAAGVAIGSGGIVGAYVCHTVCVALARQFTPKALSTSQAHLLPSYKTSYTLQTARRDKRTLTVDISLTFPKLVSSPGGARRAVSGGAGMN